AYSALNGTLPRRLAGLLPPDVRVWRVSLAPEGFDARFSALARRYVYRVSDNPVGVEPLHRNHVLWHPRPLNLDLLNEAARRGGTATPPPPAGWGRARRPSATCCASSGRATSPAGTLRPRPSRRTRAASGWSARWSGRC